MEGGLGLGGSVHEAHPCFPCFVQSVFKSIDAGSIYCPLVQLIPSINHSIRKKILAAVPCAPKFNWFPGMSFNCDCVSNARFLEAGTWTECRQRASEGQFLSANHVRSSSRSFSLRRRHKLCRQQVRSVYPPPARSISKTSRAVRARRIFLQVSDLRVAR